MIKIMLITSPGEPGCSNWLACTLSRASPPQQQAASLFIMVKTRGLLNLNTSSSSTLVSASLFSAMKLFINKFRKCSNDYQ